MEGKESVKIFHKLICGRGETVVIFHKLKCGRKIKALKSSTNGNVEEKKSVKILHKINCGKKRKV